jgi:DNA-binding PadR family transcriptional regulator
LTEPHYTKKETINLILSVLKEEPMKMYEIADKIKRRPHSQIGSLLNELKSGNLVKITQIGRNKFKIYSLNRTV